jgi:hypothetical protein
VNLIETANALALAQAFDNRTVGEANVRAWNTILGDLEAADVMEAIRRHYLAESARIMPAHVTRLVGEIQQERAKAARRWAPGQHGVPLADAVPELPKGDRLTTSDISPDVLDLLGQLRAALPDVPRGKLFPRQEAWKREQAAFRRADTATPNPHYRPGDLVAPEHAPNLLEQARDLCRANGPHDSGMHVDICPDYSVNGVHQHAASCRGTAGELLCGEGA